MAIKAACCLAQRRTRSARPHLFRRFRPTPSLTFVVHKEMCLYHPMTTVGNLFPCEVSSPRHKEGAAGLKAAPWGWAALGTNLMSTAAEGRLDERKKDQTPTAAGKPFGNLCYKCEH